MRDGPRKESGIAICRGFESSRPHLSCGFRTFPEKFSSCLNILSEDLSIEVYERETFVSDLWIEISERETFFTDPPSGY